MSPDKLRNMGHSTFERLLNYARANKEDFNLLLFRYGIERLLYRLSISSHADRFILKGASLFLVWKGQNYRVTKDADLLGIGPADTERIKDTFEDLCQLNAYEEDGMEFKADTIVTMPIREEQSYDGIRVTLMGMLHQARIPLQVDIGFGDAVTPKPEKIQFPTLLDNSPPQLLAYPRYTMVAEKLEATVRLGMANSRMKDFYDLWLISRLFDFDGTTLCNAVRNTFKRRGTKLPEGLPMAFTDEFKKDRQKQIQWRAFLRKSKPMDEPGELDKVLENVSGFLMPVINTANENRSFKMSWPPNGPWKHLVKG